MAYEFVVDSTCDLRPEFLAQNNVTRIPLEFVIDNKTYVDDRKTITPARFFEMVRGGLSATTCQINIDRFEKEFSVILDQGKDLLYLAFSSALSGTCNNAFNAAESLKSRYPDRKIIVIDSVAASGGEGLIIHLALKKRDAGATIDELADYIKYLIPKTCHWVLLDDLNHLYRGGRITRSSALLGGLVGIKPIVFVDHAGRLISRDKVRGRKKGLATLVDYMKKIYDYNAPENDTVLIIHADALGDAEELARMVRAEFKINTLVTEYMGSIIGSHTGSGTLALFFIGTDREVGYVPESAH